MKIKMLAHSPEPERIVACAGKLCYSNKADIDSLWDSITPEEADKFIEKIISSGHHSVLEHISYTFAIEGVSRSLLCQLSRHRIGISLSVRSQRYCSEDSFETVMPSSIANNETVKDGFNAVMKDIKMVYDVFVNKFNIPKEDARAILPNACCTRMIVTMNARELLHFFSLRCCQRAEFEIRKLANEMLKLCKQVSPTIFKNAGASCVQNGFCPEGKMSCGRVNKS